MPYTFAHIGYILPIKKKWKDKFSITGLVFGSLAPDYDILFRLTKVRTHIFQYDLTCIFFLIYPLALVSAIFFHLFCRNIIIEHLPLVFEEKYKKYKTFNFTQLFKNRYLTVSFSIISAIFIHLILDFLCHIIDAGQVKKFVLEIFMNDITANISFLLAIYALPILFSLAGFYLIYVYEYKRKISLRNLELAKEKFLFWIILLLITILFSLIKFYITEVDKEFFVDYIIISITTSFLVAVYATCILYFFIQKIKTA